MSEETRRLSASAARLILGVDPSAGDDQLRRAFRAAVKRTHPDRSGGDDASVRLVIEAYRLLRPDAAIKPGRRPRPPRLTISPLHAVLGGWCHARLPDSRDIRVRLPAGLRAGDPVSVDGWEAVVAIAGDANAAVLGDHFCLAVEVEPSLLRQGGRLMVDTPRGAREIWVSAQDAARGVVRALGQGLPARGAHARGHMFIRLLPARDVGPISPVEHKLRRFAAAWAA